MRYFYYDYLPLFLSQSINCRIIFFLLPLPQSSMDAPCKVLTSSNFATMSTNGTLQTVEYKMSSCSKGQMDPDYQCNQTHSITSTGSSNHTELLRAYEFGKRLRESVLMSTAKVGAATSPTDAVAAASTSAPGNRQTLRVQTHDHQVNNSSVYYEPSNVTSIATEDDDITDPPTDPGIRRFTKSPPKPNEQRISGCYNRLYREDDDITINSQSKHMRTRQSNINTIDVNDDSTDDGGNDHEDANDDDDDEVNLDDDIHGDFNKDDDDSDQSILTASPALSEEVRSNASNVSSLVTPTNDQLEENDEDDEDEDDEEDDDSTHAIQSDKGNQDVIGISEEQDDENDVSEERKQRSSNSCFVSPKKGKKSIISRSTHWSVRSNAAYLSNDTNAIKSSVKVSHCKTSDALSSSSPPSSSSSSAYHRTKNNNRTSHNRGTSSDGKNFSFLSLTLLRT